MNHSMKLGLDIGLGAVVPILILNYLTQPLGAPTAYVVAALVPVTWVAIDLALITRSFNYITSYAGLTAIINGVLAFWFVDGLLFALKDSAAYLVGLLVLAGSIAAGRPMLRYFFNQVVRPDTPARRAALDALLTKPDIRRTLVRATLIVIGLNVVLGAANFWLNAVMVVAPFGSEAFNQQVAQVNAVTRVLFPLPSIAGFGAAIYLIYRAVFRHLPREAGKSPLESDFWDLMQRYEAGQEQTPRL